MLAGACCLLVGACPAAGALRRAEGQQAPAVTVMLKVDLKRPLCLLCVGCAAGALRRAEGRQAAVDDCDARGARQLLRVTAAILCLLGVAVCDAGLWTVCNAVIF